MPVRIPREYLGEGIVQFLLVDGGGRALSERLAFNRGADRPKPAVSPGDSTENSKTIKIRFPEEMRGSDVAVAVLDGGVAEPDSSVTIESQLLLQGDLRGHIEDAGWYFRHAGREVDMALDALMLTQGWRRYDVPSVLSGVYAEPTSAIEVGPEITGVVRSRWRGKPMEGAVVNILAPSIDYAGTARTDSAGRFTVTDVDFPEGTKFVVQALNPKGGNEHNFDVDEQPFPESASIVPEAPELGVAETGVDDGIDYGWRVSHVNGNMSVTLGEITVRRHKRKDPEDIYEILASRTFTSEEMEKDHITSYEEALRKIPGLSVYDGKVRSRRGKVQLWVDGTPWSTNDDSDGITLTPSKRITREAMYATGGLIPIDVAEKQVSTSESELRLFAGSYPFSMIKDIKYFRPNEAVIFNSKAVNGGGVLLFTTKDGGEVKAPSSIFMKITSPLGYQKPAEFYTPKYEFAESLDYPTRSTLYWIPIVKIDDKELELSIPAVKKLRVLIEGIDMNDKPIWTIY